MSLENDPNHPTELSPVKRALLELREMRARLEAVERARTEPIAIIGMGCRFPGGATSPESFWRLLVEGVDAIREVPSDRWDLDAYFADDPAAPGKMTTRWGGFIDGIDEFDPQLFGISPREAMAMDPQQRLLLEVGWEALEHAGIAPDRLTGSATGVFTGISSFDYVHLAMGVPEETLDSYLAQGIAHSAASGRLSYVLGLQGTALSLDTACSSSLMAVHLAVQSLRRGECRMALAGGVNAILLPTFLIGFSKSQMMSTDGRCKTFDAAADGFVRGEGCGVVVLKRLSDALADRDTIWAVIRGSAANQDGRSSGMTAPNGLAQEAVIRGALADAGIQPWQVGYVETHGTGTPLGDPIEVRALGAVLGQGREGQRPLLLGSLKTNVGHMEAAAGVAAVIKAALSLRHGEIPPSLHVREPNPYIPWSQLPVAVAAERMPFPKIAGNRVAGVSSFGFTGTNVHVIVEAAPPVEEPRGRVAVESPGNGTPPAAAPERPLHLLKLSARSDAALDELVHRWIGFLDSATEPFADICYTAAVGRADLPERLAVLASSAAEARNRLAAFARGEETAGVLRGRAADSSRTRVAFLFTGHGAQHLNMGRELYETQPTFRAALQRCEALLRPHLERPLLAVLYPQNGAEAEPLLLGGMSYSQPALFALEYALSQLWRSWGIKPAAVLGHSVGEYAAAVNAGVFSLEDGIRLVAARGRLMDKLPERGAMLAIFATSEEVESLIAPFERSVSVASINGPTEVVVSGESAAIDSVAKELSTRAIEFRRLAVAQAGHSHLLDPVLDDFEAVAATVRFSPPQIELVSCTTGQPVSAREIGDPSYWRRHLREPVRFAAGIETLRRDGCELFLEIGPHTNLVGMGSRCLPEEPGLAWLPSLRRDWDDWQQMLESVASLYVRGVEVDWSAFERDYLDAGAAPRRRVPVPTYAWQHRGYWLEHAPRGGRKVEVPAVGKTWESLGEAGRRQELQGPLDLALQSFPARWRALKRLSTQMIASTLRALGAFHGAGLRRTAAEVVTSLGILPRYERLVARWLRRLADAGILRAEGDTFTAEVPLDDEQLEPAWREAESVLEDWGFMLEYLRRCGELLPAVLTGRANALETIFPDGSFATADALYRDSVLPRYYNALAAAIVSSFVEARPGQPVRAIELGGGTGGTTATLAPLIERVGGSYHFTDVSDHFLGRAAERLGSSGTMSFGLLDVDRDPREQGYSAGSFDLIIAANVLHTAHDIPATLAHMRALLAPGGLLLLVEVTSYLDWFDVSTALLEGWDRQADALRPDHPMLSAAAWESAIREAEFAAVASFPTPGSAADVLAQHLLVAQAPLAPSSASHAPAAHRDARSNGAAAVHRETAQTEAPDALAARVASAAPHEREDLLVDYVRRHIAALLRLDSPQLLERRGRLMELGLDSLMAVELRSRLSRGLPLAEPLPATLVFDYPTVEAIVRLLSRRLDFPTPPEAAESVAAAQATVGSAPEELDALTDEEIEARLLARLELIEERIR